MNVRFPSTTPVRRLLPSFFWALLLLPLPAAEQPLTGPATENRFPPLQVPPGFKASLFACDPLIEYPSVIASGPRFGSVFLAHDYMSGLGFEIVRRSEVRLVADMDGDGYADQSTVYAGGFNSIQGLAFHDGTVFVMHAPFLTALRDRDGDGVADERRDLLTGLGLPPEENPQRLHCANGVVPGHDGWLYLALGDHGCDVSRPEGDRLILNGGGILRCRPDGRDLHVFATGLRNIYDVALDEELNVFVRDNENDGGAYKNRVYHSFFGADHGYPYLYFERPEETMAPLADAGLGSSAGGVCYLETAFPSEYRGSLFFCEWGRSVVGYARERIGSGFASMKEVEFAFSAADDPYGFKPTDVIVDWDGSLLASDWADGQRPRRGRGRIYRIRHQDQPPHKTAEPRQRTLGDWIGQLDAPGYHRRVEAQTAIQRLGRDGSQAVRQAVTERKLGGLGRLHAVWILARIGGGESIDDLFRLAESDDEARVRAQAVRALSDLCDPVLTQHRLEAGRGDTAQAARLAALGEAADKQVLLEVIIALGRMRWTPTPEWLRHHLREPDAALTHAAMQTLRRLDDWPAVLALLDLRADSPVRTAAVRAMGGQARAEIVDALRQRLPTLNPLFFDEYTGALARIHRLPGPWVYWGYRPAPRAANTVEWEQTAAIEAALDRALAHANPILRTGLLDRMQREQVPTRIETLAHCLETERSAEGVRAIISALRDRPADSVRPLFESVVRERDHATTNRLAALEDFLRGLDIPAQGLLLDLAEGVEDGPVLAEVLRQLGARPEVASRSLLRRKLGSRSPEVRAAALESLALLQERAAARFVVPHLKDADAGVRRAAALAAGRLDIKAAVEPLLGLARDVDPLVRREGLDALRRLGEPRVVPLAEAALADGHCQLVALNCLADLGGAAQLEAVKQIAARNPSLEVLRGAARALTRWQEQEAAGSPGHSRLEEAVATLHGDSGLLLRWRIIGPLATEEAARIRNSVADAGKPPANALGSASGWQTRLSSGVEARVDLRASGDPDTNAVWLGVAEATLPEPADVQFLGSGPGGFQVWLNGRSIHARARPGGFVPESDRFNARLTRGENRVIVQVPARRDARFHLRFRRRSSDAEREQLMQAALAPTGNTGRGQQVFLDAEKSQCLKCHRLGALGAQVGPDLTGVGARFSRIQLVEAILEPSRAIAPSFENVTVDLTDGRTLSGVKVAETRETLTLGNAQGRHEARKADIERLQPSALSAMPEGLEKALTQREFVDLIAFLMEQK